MTDFKDRYFDNLDKTLTRIETNLKENTDLTHEVSKKQDYTNGRVDDLEKRADKIEVDFSKLSRKPINPKNLTTWYRDPAVLRILTYLALAFLLLVGAAIKVDIGKLIQ